MNKCNCDEEYMAVADFCDDITSSLNPYIKQGEKLKVDSFGNPCRIYELSISLLDYAFTTLQTHKKAAKIWHEHFDNMTEAEYKKMRDNRRACISAADNAHHEAHLCGRDNEMV